VARGDSLDRAPATISSRHLSQILAEELVDHENIRVVRTKKCRCIQLAPEFVLRQIRRNECGRFAQDDRSFAQENIVAETQASIAA
jgi:hypothetical protein